MSMASVAEDIRVLLNDNGKGTSATDLFSFQWGALKGVEIDKQIMIRETDSVDALIKDEYEQPVFNILVRGDIGEKVKSVHDRARDIYEFLLVRTREEINNNEYVQFAPMGGLVPMGKDANNRAVFSMTFYTFRLPL